MNIPKFSTQNAVLLNIVLVTLLLLGSISIFRMPQEQFSEVPFYWVNISVPYPGASADEVERSVSIQIEREMQGISKLKEIQSVTSEAFSLVRVQFDDGISDDEFRTLYQDVRSRFSRIALPEGTLQADIKDFSSNDFIPVVEVAVYADTALNPELSYDELYTTARLLEDRFLGLSGISSVSTEGLREKQILIEADQAALEARSIQLSELLRAFQQRNVSIPAGVMETENREYLLRVASGPDSVEDFSSLIIRNSDASASLVQLGDVAHISEEYQTQGSYARFNGSPAIFLQLAKVPRGDAVGLISRARSAASDLQADFPPGIKVDFVNDSTVQIRDSIDVLVSNALQGLVLLTVILLVFLGLRNALVTALGIPLTFAITFIILEALGETLNSNTLFGLVLVLGMLVDHAIVITENAYRLRKEGMDKITAAIEGTNQVAQPIISSALTTMAAFLPLMILPGTIGKFLRVIPLTVIIALGVSVLESILFIPSHLAEWPESRRRARRPDLFERIKPFVGRMIQSVYRYRTAGLIVFVVILAGLFSTVPFLRQDLFSAEDFSLFYIEIEMPSGTSRQRTEALVKEYEDRILPYRGLGEVSNVLSSLGASSGSTALITVDLTEINEGRTRPISAIMDDFKKASADISGAEQVLFRKAQSGPPVSSPIGFRLRGDDLDELNRVSLLIEQRLQSYKDVFNISDTIESGTSELRIIVDEDRSAALGLSTAAVGAFIRGSYDGFPAGSVFFVNEEIDVVIRYAPDEALSPIDRLSALKIPTVDGRQIPFSALARIEEVPAVASIRRIDGKREVEISADILDTRTVSAINSDIESWFVREVQEQYPGITLVTGGEFSELADLLVQILRVFLIGVFLIYAVLGAQFKSYSQPFLILLSIPMAFGGVILYLVLSGTPFSTTVLYAAVALAGISVNDSIVLIDFINGERKLGNAVPDAIVAAVVTRFRPIMLTSITTIAGLLPVALGIGGYSVVWSPMAGTIIFGLMFSTTTTLLVIPLLYGVLYDRKRKKASISVKKD